MINNLISLYFIVFKSGKHNLRLTALYYKWEQLFNKNQIYVRDGLLKKISPVVSGPGTSCQLSFLYDLFHVFFWCNDYISNNFRKNN